jgi:DnaJ-class molecular chaperone
MKDKAEQNKLAISQNTEAAKRNPGDEAVAGTVQSGEALCYDCGGSGIRQGKPCVTCGGSGKIIQLIGEA